MSRRSYQQNFHGDESRRWRHPHCLLLADKAGLPLLGLPNQLTQHVAALLQRARGGYESDECLARDFHVDFTWAMDKSNDRPRVLIKCHSIGAELSKTQTPQPCLRGDRLLSSTTVRADYVRVFPCVWMITRSSDGPESHVIMSTAGIMCAWLECATCGRLVHALKEPRSICLCTELMFTPLLAPESPDSPRAPGRSFPFPTGGKNVVVLVWKKLVEDLR